MKKTSARKTGAASGVNLRRFRGTRVGDLIAELSDICGAPGREDEVRQRIVGEISRRVRNIETSPPGAVHARMGPAGGPRVMLAAHMDEVGVIVSHVDRAGYARFDLLGKKEVESLIGHTVRFPGGRIGIVRSEVSANRGTISLNDLFLDFGTPEASPARVAVGDVGCLKSGAHRLGERFVACNAGGRSSVAALVQTVLSMGRAQAEMLFAFTVQGEFGADGGLTSAAALEPHAACVVCAAPADDIPSRSEQAIHLGGGPVIAIRHGPTPSDPRFVKALVALAKNRKIRYQLGTLAEGLPGSGLPAAGRGVITAWACIPCRGLGTTAEMVDLEDVLGTARLLAALGESQLEWL
jgi:putative aminopeptidase FrvX